MAKDKFIIEPHFRLHEWVAEEKGYFKDEGLDYEFRELVQSSDGASQQLGDKVGAMQTFERGRKSDVSCACHWTVNVAAAKGHGKLYGDVYQVSTCGIFVPPDSKVKTPEDLAGVPISVGYQSGSHYTTIQALEPFLKPNDIKLKFVGLPWQRVDVAIDKDLPAASLWGITYQTGEELGLRKIADCTFMITFMFPDGVALDNVEKYMRGLKKAQMELDLRPEKYKHHFAGMIPERYRDKVDVRRFAVGERIVFLPYTQETFQATQNWIHERGIFDHAPERVDYMTAVAAE